MAQIQAIFSMNSVGVCTKNEAGWQNRLFAGIQIVLNFTQYDHLYSNLKAVRHNIKVLHLLEIIILLNVTAS